MKKKIYLKSPLRLLVTFLITLLMVSGLILLFHDSAKGESIPEYATIIVSKGDTLWNIAKNFSSENEDIRNKISEIKKINNINSDIKIGQEINIRIN